MESGEIIDEKYSNRVSLSGILDYFMLTNERPSTVVSFLRLHEASIPVIFEYSDCYPKIFQSEFIKGLNGTDVDYLFRLLDLASKSIKHMLLCQVIYRKSEFEDHFVSRCVKSLRELLYDSTVRHKYSGSSGRYGQMLDAPFNGGIPATYIAENFASDAFARLMPHLRNSIYSGRILQMDFYDSLSPINKRVLLKSLKWVESELVVKFVKQFLTYNTDVNEKYELFRTVKFERLWRAPSKMTSEGSESAVEELLNCCNYPEFAIRSALIGMDDSRDIIFHMLFTTDLRILFEMLEMDREKLDGICRISDLLQCLKKQFEHCPK